jgi:hypothetical protein
MNELRLAAQLTDVRFFSLSRLADVTGSVISFFLFPPSVTGHEAQLSVHRPINIIWAV